MPTTVPNQKIIHINKDRVKEDFLQINNCEWMEVNKKFNPYTLQLYLYLASNSNGYNLALSQQGAENKAGIKRTVYNERLRLLEEEGYLVWKQGNIYDFYTTPRPKGERSHPDNHNEGIDFEDEENRPAIRIEKPSDGQENSPHEMAKPQGDPIRTPSIKEIDNIRNGDIQAIDNGDIDRGASFSIYDF